MRTDVKLNLVASALVVALAMPMQSAQAQNRGGDSHGHDNHGPAFHGPDFHGRDFNHFTPYERQSWGSGRWEHGWHDNRFAWWWVAGGGWYFYPAPIYPYPTYVPPAIVVQQPPPVPTGLPPAQFWYYCDNPQGYYPYVAACNSAWRAVPVTPSQ